MENSSELVSRLQQAVRQRGDKAKILRILLLGYFYFFERDLAPTRRVRPHFDRQLAFEQIRYLDDDVFKRRYRISSERFQFIFDSLGWEQQVDRVGREGPHPAVKMLCAIRQLVDGSMPFQVCDTYKMSETTASRVMKEFCRDMIKFHSDYLKPDWDKSLKAAKLRGINGYLGSPDCTHVGWHACPRAYAQGHKDRNGNISLILEAVCDSDLRIIHNYFGMPGGANDLNVLQGSPLVNLIRDGKYPNKLGNKLFDTPYIMVDGIYQRWKHFAKTVRNPQGERDCDYAAFQEGVRKDIERCFGILKRCFQFLAGKTQKRSVELITQMVTTCLILQNMRVEDKEIEESDELTLDSVYDRQQARQAVLDSVEVLPPSTLEMRAEARARMNDLENLRKHTRLQEALKDFVQERNRRRKRRRTAQNLSFKV